jgi:hypothetical protein
MQKNNWVFGLVVLVIVMGLSIWGFGNGTANPTGATTPSNVEPTVAGVDTSNFFDDNATIMFFYSDGCGWCSKEKLLLAELADEGYKVKPMDVGKDTSLWKTYNISGTPAFIDKNGQRSEGYMEKDVLKAWLDTHK